MAIARLKLRGRAKQCIEAEPDLKTTTSWNTLKGELKRHFTITTIKGTAMRDFIECKQRVGEPCRQYLMRLKVLGNKTISLTGDEVTDRVLKNKLEQDLITQFLLGLLMPIKQRVLSRNPGSIAEAIEIEIVDETERRVRTPNRPFKQGNKDYRDNRYGGLNCWTCGRAGHIQRFCRNTSVTCYACNKLGLVATSCPNKTWTNSRLTCFNCKKPGHMAQDCRKEENNGPRYNKFKLQRSQCCTPTSGCARGKLVEENKLFVGMNTCCLNGIPKPKKSVEVSINGKKCMALIDSGAVVSLVKPIIAQGFKINKLRDSLVDIQGNAIPTKGEVVLPITFKGTTTVTHACTVIETASFQGELLLGIDFLYKFNVKIDWGNGCFYAFNEVVEMQVENSGEYKENNVLTERNALLKETKIILEESQTNTMQKIKKQIDHANKILAEALSLLSIMMEQGNLTVDSSLNALSHEELGEQQNYVQKLEKSADFNGKFSVGVSIVKEESPEEGKSVIEISKSEESVLEPAGEKNGVLEVSEERKRALGTHGTYEVLVRKEKAVYPRDKRQAPRRLPFPLQQNVEKGFQVVLEEDMRIPPMCQVLCTATLREVSRVTTPDLVLEPTDGLPKGLLVARTLCRKGRKVPIRFLNITEKEIMVNRKHEVARVFEVTVENSKASGAEKNIRQVQKKDTEDILSQLNLQEMKSEEEEKLRSLIIEFIDIFRAPDQKLTCTKDVMHRIITEDVHPICKRPYRVPFQRQEIMNKEINKLLHDGVIVESQSPWNFPALLIEKKRHPGEDTEYRLCIDYRLLNDITKTDYFPLPNIHETIDRLACSKYCSTMDLASGYFQVSLHPDDQEKTAFSTPDNHYHFVRMPMGLKNAPATRRGVD